MLFFLLTSKLQSCSAAVLPYHNIFLDTHVSDYSSCIKKYIHFVKDTLPYLVKLLINLVNTFIIYIFVQYARQLSELLHYLEHHPMGSIALANIYNSDFVIASNKLKLVDLDDLVIGEKSCRFNADCKIPGASQVSKCLICTCTCIRIC